ncbi:unnamed protein product, partial [Discosporangium mesarthrocarpum]
TRKRADSHWGGGEDRTLQSAKKRLEAAEAEVRRLWVATGGPGQGEQWKDGPVVSPGANPGVAGGVASGVASAAGGLGGSGVNSGAEAEALQRQLRAAEEEGGRLRRRLAEWKESEGWVKAQAMLWRWRAVTVAASARQEPQPEEERQQFTTAKPSPPPLGSASPVPHNPSPHNPSPHNPSPNHEAELATAQASVAKMAEAESAARAAATQAQAEVDSLAQELALEREHKRRSRQTAFRRVVARAARSRAVGLQSRALGLWRRLAVERWAREAGVEAQRKTVASMVALGLEEQTLGLREQLSGAKAEVGATRLEGRLAMLACVARRWELLEMARAIGRLRAAGEARWGKTRVSIAEEALERLGASNRALRANALASALGAAVAQSGSRSVKRAWEAWHTKVKAARALRAVVTSKVTRSKRHAWASWVLWATMAAAAEASKHRGVRVLTRCLRARRHRSIAAALALLRHKAQLVGDAEAGAAKLGRVFRQYRVRALSRRLLQWRARALVATQAVHGKGHGTTGAVGMATAGKGALPLRLVSMIGRAADRVALRAKVRAFGRW